MTTCLSRRRASKQADSFTPSVFIAAAAAILGWAGTEASAPSQVTQVRRITASPTGDRQAITDASGNVIAQGDRFRHSEMPQLVIVPNANPSLVKRYLVFNSSANDLQQMVGVLDTDASQMDVYRVELDANLAVVAIDRVSGIGINNSDPNHGSAFASISPDGAFIAFQSPATDLAPEDADGAWSVFARRMDVAGGPVMLVSDNLWSAADPNKTGSDCTDDTVGAAVRTDGTTTAVARDASGVYHVFWVSQAGYVHETQPNPCDDPLGPGGLNFDVFRFSFDPATGATSRIAVSDGDLT